MSEVLENVDATAEAESIQEGADSPEVSEVSQTEKVEASLEDRFDALVSYLKEHGIHFEG